MLRQIERDWTEQIFLFDSFESANAEVGALKVRESRVCVSVCVCMCMCVCVCVCVYVYVCVHMYMYGVDEDFHGWVGFEWRLNCAPTLVCVWVCMCVVRARAFVCVCVCVCVCCRRKFSWLGWC